MPTPQQALGLTDTTDVTDLIPEDVYSRLILEALYASRKLSGVVAAVVEDMQGRGGSTVQVPYISRRSLPSTVAEGASVTAADSDFGTYPIAITKYGDRDTVNAEVWEDQAIFTRADFIRNMGGAFGEKVDDLVYTALETATAGNTIDLTAAGTLTDLYDKVVDLKAAMQKDFVTPTHLIIGPDQEAQFLKDTDEGIKFQQISVRDGQVLMVAGLEVVVTPLANANATTADLVQAIIIDKSRAVGEAWGRRPNFEVQREAVTDQYEVVGFIRYGTDDLDPDAIGHVKNA